MTQPDHEASPAAAPLTYRRHDDIAVVTLQAPPVNALSHAVRSALAGALVRAAQEDVRAIVITGSARMFSAGADITEFGGAATQPPLLTDLTRIIEDQDRPVISAVEGLALGGGLEIALASHARLGSPHAQFALPEINLGLIPGAGGTQRLPRLVGPADALEIIAGGSRVDAAKAREIGLIDAIVEGDFLCGVLEWARQDRVLARTRDRDERRVGTLPERRRFDEVSAEILRRAANPRAVAACIEAVAAAREMPFEEGVARERALFEELVASDESAGQRYSFLSERAARRLAAPGSPRPPVQRAVVIGAGTMGSDIAVALLLAGVEVTLCDTDPAARDRARTRIAAALQRAVRRGDVIATEAAVREERLRVAEDHSAVADADLVIEAIIEDMDAKKRLFEVIGRMAPAHAILATNTSYLDVNVIAEASGRPADVLGMHFFSPAHIMPVVEVVRTDRVEADAVRSVAELVVRLDKAPVIVGVCHGFVGNRMLARRTDQAEKMLLEGAVPAQIDRVIREFGFRMGPFEVSDLSGLDIGWRNRQPLGITAPVADALVERGWLGQKAGRGFYRYEGRERFADPEVESLIVGLSATSAMTRRDISDAEILDRLVLPMVDEAAKILAEGIAARGEDIDVLWRGGYGWPVTRGGPVWYARRRGLAAVYARLDELADRAGDETLYPSRALRALRES